jgi:calcineurin-like phosphoesterase family protein
MSRAMRTLNLFRSGLFGALLMFAAWAAAAADLDAPYVMRDGAGRLEAWTVEATPAGPAKRTRPLKPGSKITVAAVGSAPAFTVKLRPPADLAPDKLTTVKSPPLFVVADTHGEYEIFAAMLIKHGVVDAKLHWLFGRGHLVMLGDVFDRGPNQTEILWLLYALEAEARGAGGGVDFVLGNHETMALRGDLRYLNPKYREVTTALGVGSYSRLFAANSVLGQWLRTRPTVLQIDHLLFLHGGISKELVARGFALSEINGTVRAVLNDGAYVNEVARERADFLFGESGPLWYRGYFADEAGVTAASDEDVRLARQRFGVDRILVGHTRVPTITPLYGGQVIAVQVYPRRDSSGNTSFEALLIRDGTLLRARPDGSTGPLLP